MNMNQNPPENLVKMQRAGPCPRVSDSASLGRGLEMFHSNVFPGDAAGPGSNSEKCQMNQSFSVVPWNAAICVQLFRSKDRLLFQMEPAGQKDEPFNAREMRLVKCPSQVGKDWRGEEIFHWIRGRNGITKWALL